jgi:hypothetical protein
MVGEQQETTAAASPPQPLEHTHGKTGGKGVEHRLVVAMAAMFRAGDTIASATAAPREAVRHFFSGARTRAGRVAEEARALARRKEQEARAAASAAKASGAEEGGGRETGAAPSSRKTSKGPEA